MLSHLTISHSNWAFPPATLQFQGSQSHGGPATPRPQEPGSGSRGHWAENLPGCKGAWSQDLRALVRFPCCSVKYVRVPTRVDVRTPPRPHWASPCPGPLPASAQSPRSDCRRRRFGLIEGTSNVIRPREGGAGCETPSEPTGVSDAPFLLYSTRPPARRAWPTGRLLLGAAGVREAVTRQPGGNQFCRQPARDRTQSPPRRSFR